VKERGEEDPELKENEEEWKRGQLIWRKVLSTFVIALLVIKHGE